MSVSPPGDTDPMELADDLVAEWHEGASPKWPLRSHLKLSWQEYKTFVERSTLPDDFTARHGDR